MTISRLSPCHSVATRLARKPYYGEGRVEVRTGDRGDDRFDAYCPSNIESPVQPPWRVLPWPHAAQTVHRPSAVKPVLVRADVSGVGRTLDVFV